MHSSSVLSLFIIITSVSGLSIDANTYGLKRRSYSSSNKKYGGRSRGKYRPYTQDDSYSNYGSYFSGSGSPYDSYGYDNYPGILPNMGSPINIDANVPSIGGSTSLSPSMGTSSPNYPSTTPSTGNSNSALDYNSMLLSVNKLRSKYGVPPLKYNDKLNKAAQAHSDDQARTRKMSHTGSNGSTADERVTQAGYNWKSVAENVAWNQKTVDSVMDAWIKSPGHLKNLISGDYTDFGAGCNNYYWTQVFASQ